MDINLTAYTISASIFKLMMLAIGGYVAYSKKLLDDNFIEKLNQLLIKFIFPSLILSTIIPNFNFNDSSIFK